MERIAILYCKRIKDVSCVACGKCFKAASEGSGEFARRDAVQIAAMTDCGDCPGLVVPRVKQLKELGAVLDTPIDTVYFGTCMKLAMETSHCPIDFEDTEMVVTKQLGVDVVLGTHAYQ